MQCENMALTQNEEVTEMNLFDLTGEVAAVMGATGVLGGAMAEALVYCRINNYT